MNVKRTLILFVARIFNVVYSVSKYLGWDLVPMTTEQLVKPLTPEERKEVLNNDFNEPMKLIFECCNDPSNSISGFQRLSLLQMIRDFVRARAAVKGAVDRNPDILNTPVDGPIVIVGLARSGTTMLQRLLACDPRFICPMTWEMINPTPPGRSENWRESERYRIGKKAMDLMSTMITDDFKRIHKFGADEYEECLMLIGHCFMHFCQSAPRELQEWTEFQLDCPKEYQMKVYKFYKMALQCLFYKNNKRIYCFDPGSGEISQCRLLDENTMDLDCVYFVTAWLLLVSDLNGNKTLLLKSPIHLLYLETYKEILPNAKFIFTYRQLSALIPSFASLQREFTIFFGSEVDKKYIGQESLKFFRKSFRGALNTFEKMEQDSYITMGYSKIMKDPLAAVSQIYSHFNLELTPEVRASMQHHLGDYKQNKFGKHQYNLEEYGITEEDLKKEMKEFLEYFKDSGEKLI